jgi:hypothetical protein
MSASVVTDKTYPMSATVVGGGGSGGLVTVSSPHAGGNPV